MKNLEQGQLVKWVNTDNQEIVWMVTQDVSQGIVIHSDELVKVGTLNNLSDIKDLKPFIGTVHIESK